jgi:hypothetical protein
VSLARTLRTARRIPARQLKSRLRFLALRRLYSLDPKRPFARAAEDAAGTVPAGDLPRVEDDVLWPSGLDALERRAAEFARGQFVYLNVGADFARGIRWRDRGASALWIYQLQYLGSVADLARTGRVADAVRIVASWRKDFEGRWDHVAWHPYPTSLRLVNLCVAARAAGGFDALGAGVAQLVAQHAAYLLRHVENDVRGNHLLENARALLWAGRAFRGGAASTWERAARAIFEEEIPEQILPDGGHFELSPMYHCIVMRDLLEVRSLLGEGDPLVQLYVTPAVKRMAAFLSGIVCPDGDIPLLGDSVRGFGPPPATLLRLAGAKPNRDPGVKAFAHTGLHVMRNERIWAIFDAGPVCPPYLPAHGQADSLTIEVWVDGVCVVCDAGVFDYEGAERAWGRSTRAHSAPAIGDADTSEVYGSFRVGGLAVVDSVGVAAAGDEVVAQLRPYGSSARVTRSVRLFGNSLTIEDVGAGPANATLVSRLHLAPGPKFKLAGDAARGGVSAAHSLAADVAFVGPAAVEKGRLSREFGLREDTVILRQSTTAAGGRLRWVIGPP